MSQGDFIFAFRMVLIEGLSAYVRHYKDHISMRDQAVALVA